MFGFININKPPGLTSRQAVDRLKRCVKPEKIGHAGTLDPLATGVLVVGIGPATRLIRYVQQQPKHYRGTFLLGRESPSEDIETELTLLEDPPVPTLDEIQQAARRHTGTIHQRPPAYSAVKIEGRRAYKLAREGAKVETKPKPVTIYELNVASYDYPELVLDIRCSGGTYVRSLGRDLAASLSTAAVMSALTRTAVGSFLLVDACDLDMLDAENVREHLQSPLLAVADLPQVALNADEVQRITRGMTVDHSPEAGVGEVAAINPQGELVAILTPRHGKLGPVRVFV